MKAARPVRRRGPGKPTDRNIDTAPRFDPTGSPKDSPRYAARCNADPPNSGPQHMSRTCSDPGSRSYAGPTISATPTKSTSTDCSKLIQGCGPRGTRSKSSTGSTKPTTSTAPTRRWDGSPTSTPPAIHREYHDIVDTIIAWGEEILAYHSSRRASNGPLEGINNLLQVLRRVDHGFTNYDNYAARGSP